MTTTRLPSTDLHRSSSADIKGVAIAASIVTCWGALFLALLLTKELSPTIYIVTLPVITFLYVGLFITAHDAMHGLVAPSYPRLNAAIGRLAVWCYALFSYNKLLKEHWRHHSHPGVPGNDPDFHDGSHRGFVMWYLHFMWHYTSVAQLLRIAIAVQVAVYLFGITESRIMLAFGIPGLLSSLQLFYFGTYLPHRDQLPHGKRASHADKTPAFADHHNARSNDFPVWLSFVTCYHFGYHLEHHRFPRVPWWALPQVRRERIP